jgi:hypothetical protein
MAPTPILGKDDVLQMLRGLETALGTLELENQMAQQGGDTLKKFVKLRQEVTILKGRLENAQLASIAGRLDDVAVELNAGIEKMQNALTAIDNAIAIVNSVSSVLDLVGRVVALAK